MSQFPDYAQLANIGLIEEMYAKYLKDMNSVDRSWRSFFEGIEFGSFAEKGGGDLKIVSLIQAYRREGHLFAHFNPLRGEAGRLDLKKFGFTDSEMETLFPSFGFCETKEAPLREIAASLEKIYSSRIGFEYMGLENPELEKWIQKKIEPKLAIELPIEEKRLAFESLCKSAMLETFLHTKYVGQTRFSLEGAETMVPMIAEMIDLGADLGIDEWMIGMAHRGRLNVLTSILNKPYELIFEEFENDAVLSFTGNDDVKYHMGFSSQLTTRSGKSVSVELAANPSHLESVDPVVLGQTFAKQILKKRAAPLLIHGDASLAGQGVVYESMQLKNLPAYSVGGTIHLVVNNQIGYTTLPDEGRSTRYCTDIAKSFGAPVFHVNAEDPESCLFVSKLATQIRQEFHLDVFIDLVCYRKYGHNEGDEPSFTQPLQYEKIRSKKSIRQLYHEELMREGHVEEEMAEEIEAQFKEKLNAALDKAKINGKKKETPSPLKEKSACDTRVSLDVLKKVMDDFCKIPETLHPHPKLTKWLDAKKSGGAIDWATAEMLSFGSLLWEGVSVRLAGQDSKRGTFSQRHIIWIDQKTGESYCPLCQIKGGRFDAVNSPLTEFAGLGFEYGYSLVCQKGLTLWEAQYGDFFNGAQIIIDQYIASGEQKWNTPSGIVLLLPHGYEGAGPEHSSARLERFLQLAAFDNIQVAYPSTPSQYFHLLRRQALQERKKPLIVLTPKSLLRAPQNVSSIEALTNGSFEEILQDQKPPLRARRVLLCTGKIYYELFNEREKKNRTDVAILRLEQIYPLNEERIKEVLGLYVGASEWFWVQEEPENMGAWSFIRFSLEKLLSKGAKLSYIGRVASATTATGSKKRHGTEQQELLDKGFA